MAAPKIVVVGSLNCDVVCRVPHLPRGGETLTAREVTRVSGGKGANQAVAAARLGAAVTLVGAVGDDDDGRVLTREVAATGVKLAVQTVPQVATGAAYLSVADDGENHIVLAPGANAELKAASVRAAASVLAEADVLLLQLETTLEAIEAAVSLVGSQTQVVLDPAPAVPLPKALLQRVDVFSPNQTEAAVYVGEADAATQARKLVDRYGGWAVMKLGAGGAIATNGTTMIEQPALSVDPVVDTTAAGDAFTAALAVEFGRGETMATALATACLAGSIAVTIAGAQPSLPTRDAIQRKRSTLPPSIKR